MKQDTSPALEAARLADALYPELVAARIPAEALNDPQALAAAIGELRNTYPEIFAPLPSGGGADGGAGRGAPALVRADLNSAIQRAFERRR